ncbi:MAG: O-antigen ligase family protein [Proteobacteria bacterium]|nr:O-antigen ligase family protein [Pseudomonadota bacterium]
MKDLKWPFAAFWFLLIGISGAFLITPYYYLAPIVSITLVAGLLLFQKPVYGLLVIICLVPFEDIFNQFSSFTGSKFIGLALIGVVFIKLVLRAYPASLMRTRLWGPIFLLLCFYILSAFNSPYSVLALKPIKQLMTAIILFTVTLIMEKDIDLIHIITAILISIALSAIFTSALPSSDPTDRVTGLLADPNYFALLLCSAFPLSVYMLKVENRTIYKYFWFSIIIVIVISLVKTYSRSGLVVLGLTIGMMAIYYRDILKAFSPRYLGLIIAAIIISLSTISILIPDSYVERIKSLGALAGGISNVEDRSLGRRTAYLNVGMTVVKNHPFLGNGPGSFPENFAKSEYARALAFKTQGADGDLYRMAHNTYLEILSEVGALGFLSFIFLMLMANRNFKRARINYLRNDNTMKADLVMHLWFSFIAIAFFLLFLSSIKNKYLWILLAVSQIVLNRSVKQKELR